MLYNSSLSSLEWWIIPALDPRMKLNPTGLYIGGILVYSSDKRLKFNEKPLVSALDVIDRLELVEYDQTHDFFFQIIFS